MISPHIPTHPAHTTLFTGLDVFDHHIVAQGGIMRPPAGIRYLPEILRAQGYYTAAVDNINLWIGPTFERYVSTARWDHDGSKPWRNGEEVTNRGLAVLEEAQSRNQPFFVFLHYWDPHTPYLPPPPFDRMFYDGDERNPANRSMDRVWNSPWFRRYFNEWIPGVTDIEFVKAQYDSSIAYSDHCVGIILDKLLEMDRWEDTLIVLQSDHGEELDDHAMWFDHHGLYDTNVRVPFLLRIPNIETTGDPITGMTSLLDVAPTVLAALGIPDGSPSYSRKSLLSVQVDSGSTDAVYLTECTWMRKAGWRTAKWKLIQALEPDIYGGAEIELYDLEADPREHHNLASELPEIVEMLSSTRDRHVERRLRESGQPDPLVDQAEALRTWQPRFITGKT